MHFSQRILFATWGYWVALLGAPVLAHEPVVGGTTGEAEAEATAPAAIRVKNQAKRRQRQSSRPPFRPSLDDDKPPMVGGRSAGSRGCIAETETTIAADSSELRDRLPALMLLAPLDRIAQTQSTQPLLAWYLRDQSPSPFIFRLYEVEGEITPENLNDPRQAWRLMAEATLPSSKKYMGSSEQSHVAALAGISVLKLSALPESPKLRVGGHYVWQIEVICDPERPSRNLFAQAALKRVTSSPSNLTLAKADVLDELLRQELWQDALILSLESSGASLHSSAQTPLESVVMNDEELEAIQRAAIHR